MFHFSVKMDTAPLLVERCKCAQVSKNQFGWGSVSQSASVLSSRQKCKFC